MKWTGRLSVRAESGPQISVVRQVLRRIEQSGSPTLRVPIADVVLRAYVGSRVRGHLVVDVEFWLSGW
jgi:hypothetical protein